MVITSEDCKGDDQVSVDGSLNCGSIPGTSNPGTAYNTVTSMDPTMVDRSEGQNLIVTVSIDGHDIGSANDLVRVCFMAVCFSVFECVCVCVLQAHGYACSSLSSLY